MGLGRRTLSVRAGDETTCTNELNQQYRRGSVMPVTPGISDNIGFQKFRQLRTGQPESLAQGTGNIPDNFKGQGRMLVSQNQHTGSVQRQKNGFPFCTGRRRPGLRINN